MFNLTLVALMAGYVAGISSAGAFGLTWRISLLRGAALEHRVEEMWPGIGIKISLQFSIMVAGTVPLDIGLPFFVFAHGLWRFSWLCMCYRCLDCGHC